MLGSYLMVCRNYLSSDCIAPVFGALYVNSERPVADADPQACCSSTGEVERPGALSDSTLHTFTIAVLAVYV